MNKKVDYLQVIVQESDIKPLATMQSHCFHSLDAYMFRHEQSRN